MLKRPCVRNRQLPSRQIEQHVALDAPAPQPARQLMHHQPRRDRRPVDDAPRRATTDLSFILLK